MVAVENFRFFADLIVAQADDAYKVPGRQINYVMVESYGLAQKMYDNRPREPFYACFSIDDALDAQSVIALSRNGRRLK